MHPQDRARAREILRKATEKGIPFEYVARFRTAPGVTRLDAVRGVPVFSPQGSLLKRIGVIQDVTEQARAEDDLRQLSQQLMRARDDDQRHLARELHESVGQTLAALKMTLARLRDASPEGNRWPRALLGSAAKLADAAVREVRTISYLMHPPMLDEAGLIPALRWLVSGFAERSGIRVQVDIDDNLPRQSQQAETTIFRIVQEALTNVHRHSGSATAKVHLTCAGDQIVVEVRDHGRGMVERGCGAERRAKHGIGITGMRERLRCLGGTLEISSSDKEGTVIRAVLPRSDGCRGGPDLQNRYAYDAVKDFRHDGSERKNATGERRSSVRLTPV